jgi:hypothetical protein
MNNHLRHVKAHLEAQKRLNMGNKLDNLRAQQEMMDYQMGVRHYEREAMDNIQEKYKITLKYSEYLEIQDNMYLDLSILRNYDLTKAKEIIDITISDYIDSKFNKVKATALAKKMHPYQEPTEDGYILVRKS